MPRKPDSSPVWLVPILSVLLLTGACGSGPTDPSTDLDLRGTWTSTYTCNDSCTGRYNGSDTLLVSQTGNDISFVDEFGNQFRGTLSGNVVTWSGGNGSTYTESGTWTVAADARSFTKSTSYEIQQGAGICRGTCTGNGTRQ
jgi:hypothetical protein